MLMYLVPILLFAAGTLLGSFLNVLILRYGSARSVVWDRSACRICRQTLRWWELLPLASYVLLRGKCARCRAPISWQYPFVEMVTGLVVVAVLTPWPASAHLVGEAIVLVAIASALLVLGVIDLRTFLLPDSYVILLGVLVVSFRLLQQTLFSRDALLGALTGAGFLLFLWVITRGQGIGLGDVKVMVPLGLLFGGVGTITLLFLAFCLGGFIGLLLLWRGRAGMRTPIPFGPFLTGVALLLLLRPSWPHYFFYSLLGI